MGHVILIVSMFCVAASIGFEIHFPTTAVSVAVYTKLMKSAKTSGLLKSPIIIREANAKHMSDVSPVTVVFYCCLKLLFQQGDRTLHSRSTPPPTPRLPESSLSAQDGNITAHNLRDMSCPDQLWRRGFVGRLTEWHKAGNRSVVRDALVRLPHPDHRTTRRT